MPEMHYFVLQEGKDIPACKLSNVYAALTDFNRKEII